MSRSPNVKILGNELRVLIENDPLDKRRISRYILGKSDDYLAQSLSRNHIEPSCLHKLCEYLKVNEEEYIQGKSEDSQEVDSLCNQIIPTMGQIYYNQKTMVDEIRNLQLQNIELIKVIKDMQEMMKQLNSNVNTTTEKVKAIFTEVKYNQN